MDLGAALIQAGSQTAFSMTIAYMNYFIFLPRFLERKIFWLYLVEFLIPFAIIISLRIVVTRYLVDGYTHSEDYGYFYSTVMIVQTAATSLFLVIFVGMLRFAKDWFEFEARKKEVENEKLIAELNFLKAQINPHFLFNTLNNLYYLAFTQSPNTTEVIEKLSQMMRYMIYDSNHPLVPIAKEIEYMQNYISLERLRLNNSIPIDFEIRGNIEGARIAPLIFITFIENAFKHGVSNNQPGAWVKISVVMDGKQCTYRVENSKLTPAGEEKSGIGLQNVGRRLDLTYPDQYTLDVVDKPDHYAVQLNLTLS